VELNSFYRLELFKLAEVELPRLPPAVVVPLSLRI
jgi:hypothetical protein